MMAVSPEPDVSNLQSTSTTGTDKRRENIRNVLRSHEHLTLYQPLRVCTKTNVISFTTAETKWKLYIGTLQLPMEEAHVRLKLLSGAKRAIISYVINFVDRHTEEDKSHKLYLSGSNVLRVNSQYTVLLNLRTRKDWFELKDQTEYALVLSLKILEISPQISIPDCSLNADVQSTIANEEEFQDVTLIVGTEDSRQEIKANKFMLVARSPVFACMFNTEMKEKGNGTVEIPDIHPVVCKEMLSFMYTGRLAELKSVQMAEDLLVAAEKYELLRLKAMCENRIAPYLCVSNAAHILSFANMYCGKQLKDEVIEFIASDSETCSEVMKTEGWKEVEEQGPLMTEVMSRLVMAGQGPSAKRPRLTL